MVGGAINPELVPEPTVLALPPEYVAVTMGYFSPTCSVAGCPSNVTTCDLRITLVSDLVNVAITAQLARAIAKNAAPVAKVKNFVKPAAEAAEDPELPRNLLKFISDEDVGNCSP